MATLVRGNGTADDDWRKPRSCACGCGTVFMPVRRHHVYYNPPDGPSHRFRAAERRRSRLYVDEIEAVARAAADAAAKAVVVTIRAQARRRMRQEGTADG